MNKDYYSILQINQNASPEIIEKAYKTLAKKYHPDLQQTAEAKKESEEILKDINEAYEVLSNKDKKQEYDNTLKTSTISQEDFDNLHKQNEFLKNKINNLQNHANFDYNSSVNSNSYNNNVYSTNSQNNDYSIQNKIYQDSEKKKQELEFKKQLEFAKKKAYYDAYIQDLKNRVYTIKYKKTFKDYIRYFVTIVVILLVLFILWQIPFIHNYFINLFENNSILKSFIQIF